MSNCFVYRERNSIFNISYKNVGSMFSYIDT